MRDLQGQGTRSDKDLFLTFAPLYITILCALLVFSCGAAKAAQEVTVQVPDGFSGTLQIDPCNASADADHVTPDARGVATHRRVPVGDSL